MEYLPKLIIRQEIQKSGMNITFKIFKSVNPFNFFEDKSYLVVFFDMKHKYLGDFKIPFKFRKAINTKDFRIIIKDRLENIKNGEILSSCPPSTF